MVCWVLGAKRSAFATEKANGQLEGPRLSRTLAKLDSYSEQHWKSHWLDHPKATISLRATPQRPPLHPS
ncbi:hypothetical protein QVD17_05947 [Tagetes erecta]|uniref:Uncharacterized protein n=1 Tax=Tagetes erecta TaxID=13708 RepID=A0AAD8LER9_TARER|nr:hypothetical protein QVD17_05947 [Tagetes erecta]